MPIELAVSDADWAAIAAAAAILAAIVSAWATWIARASARYAASQTETARAALDSALQPVVVTVARTARLPLVQPDSNDDADAIREVNGRYLVPVRNIGPGVALNVSGVLFWNLKGDEDGKPYDVTTTICTAPHPVQLGSGAHDVLEFVPLTPEPISAPDALLRLWYEGATGERYWTAERLSSGGGQGYRTVTGRWPMPSDIKEAGVVPDQYADLRAALERDDLKRRYGDSPEAGEPDGSPGSKDSAP